MSFHNSEPSKFGTKINQIFKFLKFPEIPAKNSVFPGNSRGNFWDGAFPGIPEKGHSRWPCVKGMIKKNKRKRIWL